MPSSSRVPVIAACGLILLIIGVGLVGARNDDDGSSSSSEAAPLDIAPVDPVDAPSTIAAPLDSAPTTVVAETIPPLTQTLAQGMQSNEVRRVQERLTELAFDPGPVDGIFGLQTTQAVWAFEKLVLGVPREEATGQITPERWGRLLGPVSISPRRSTNAQANHTEVYLAEQVMIVFERDVPTIISHISTGELDTNGNPKEYCEVATYDTDVQGRELDEPVQKAVCAEAKTPGGVFTYDRQVEGKRVSPLGGMWNPVYFNYGIAVHGAENVPLQPASHGCVRIPMHISEYFQSKVSIGDRILVWNGSKEPEDITERESLPSFDRPDPNATTTTTTTTSTTTTTLPPETTTTVAAPATTAAPPSTATPTTTTAPPSTTTTSSPPSTTAPASTTTAPPTTAPPADG